MVVHKALNGTLDVIIRGIFIAILLTWMGWVSATLLEIQNSRFTTQDGLAMQREIAELWKEVRIKVDLDKTPPADYRRYVDTQFTQLGAEVEELHKVIERLEGKIDRLR